MSTTGIILIVVAIVVVLLIIWVIQVQRKLVSLDEMCGNAMSQIGVQQNSRWDALGGLADMVKQYDDHEYNTLKETISSRKSITQSSSAEEVNANEHAITKVMDRFTVVAEAYPDLKANTNYQSIMDNVKKFEENVRVARMSYNDTVTKFNRTVRSFPQNIIAGMLHFNVKAYLETPTEKQEMPDLKR